MAVSDPRLRGHIVLTARVQREGKYYVARSLELGISSFGDTIEEAFDALADATLLYLKTLEEEGERRRFFEEKGIEIVPGEPSNEERSVTTRLGEFTAPLAVAVPAGS